MMKERLGSLNKSVMNQLMLLTSLLSHIVFPSNSLFMVPLTKKKDLNQVVIWLLLTSKIFMNPSVKALRTLMMLILISKLGPPMMVDMEKTRNASSVNKLPMSEERETLSATMGKNWKDRQGEFHASAVRWITNVTLVTTEPNKAHA